jgi:hypothetical protein
MSPRRLVCAAALATWLALLAPLAPAHVEAAPAGGARVERPSREPARTARPATKGARAPKKVARATRKKRTTRRRGGRRAIGAREAAPARAGTPSNMPPGWSWPPSAAMVAAGARCTTELDQLGVVWEAAAPVERVVTPITVPSMAFGGVKMVSWFRKPPFVMDCHLALALARHAEALHELGVRELKFSRIYGYTLVRAHGVTSNALSRHALGLAVDVRAVTDADGREALVERDYPQGDPLLRQVEAYLNDADGFRTVLTPKNDPVSHHDHFHLEVKVEYGP